MTTAYPDQPPTRGPGDQPLPGHEPDPAPDGPPTEPGAPPTEPGREAPDGPVTPAPPETERTGETTGYDGDDDD